MEAFDPMGVPLGTVEVSGTGQLDLDALLGIGEPISRFIVTADVDVHIIANVSAQPVVCM